MKIRKATLFLLTVLTLAGTAIGYAANRNLKHKPEPTVLALPQKTVTYSVGHFSGMDVSSSVDVKYTVGPNISLTAKGTEEDLKYLIVRVDRGVLRISRKYPVGYRRTNYEGIEITLTAPAVEKITLSGTATLTVDCDYKLGGRALALTLRDATRANFNGTVNAHEVIADVVGTSRVFFDTQLTTLTTLNTSGASTCKIDNLHTSTLKATATGASKITLSGTDKKTTLATSGASSINAVALTSRSIKTSISGASRITR
ncbi:MAG: GIN domain-containing protein [Muribaculaceae bacterium]